MDPSKVQAILDCQPPSVTQVRQFMGLCGFPRKFIPNFVTIASPITDFTRGYSNLRSRNKQNKIREETSFSWNEAQDQPFVAALKKKYATHKLEFIALKWAISEKFSDYLRTPCHCIH